MKIVIGTLMAWNGHLLGPLLYGHAMLAAQEDEGELVRFTLV